MAYDRQKLRKAAYAKGSLPSGDRRVWIYVQRDDTLADFQSPNYFNDDETDLVSGDWLLTEASDGHQAFYVASSIGGVIVINTPTGIGGGDVQSVFGRTGTVVAVGGDYDASEITETAAAKIMTGTERTKLAGIEAGATADQTASEVPSTPTGGVGATNVQAAIAELDSDKANVVHTHTMSQITNAGALATLDTVGASEIDAGSVGPTQLEDTAVTPGSFTNADITVDQDGRITAAASGAGGGAGVDSFNTRTGAVVSAVGDYAISDITVDAPWKMGGFDVEDVGFLSLEDTAANGQQWYFVEDGSNNWLARYGPNGNEPGATTIFTVTPSGLVQGRNMPVDGSILDGVTAPSNAARDQFQQYRDAPGQFTNDFVFSEATSGRALIQINPGSNTIKMTLPDATGLTGKDGWLCDVRIASGAFVCSVEVAVTGQMAVQNGYGSFDPVADEQFFGLSQDTAINNVFTLFKRGGIYQWQAGFFRNAATDDLTFDGPLQVVTIAGAAPTLNNTDHAGRMVEFTNAGAVVVAVGSLSGIGEGVEIHKPTVAGDVTFTGGVNAPTLTAGNGGLIRVRSDGVYIGV